MSVCVNGFLAPSRAPAPAPAGADSTYEAWLYSSGALLFVFIINGLSSLFESDA